MTDHTCSTCTYYAPSDDPVGWADCHCTDSPAVNPRPTESCVHWADIAQDSLNHPKTTEVGSAYPFGCTKQDNHINRVNGLAQTTLAGDVLSAQGDSCSP